MSQVPRGRGARARRSSIRQGGEVGVGKAQIATLDGLEAAASEGSHEELGIEPSTPDASSEIEGLASSTMVCANCSHPAGMHSDLADGENMGTCSAAGCDCGALETSAAEAVEMEAEVIATLEHEGSVVSLSFAPESMDEAVGVLLRGIRFDGSGTENVSGLAQTIRLQFEQFVEGLDLPEGMRPRDESPEMRPGPEAPAPVMSGTQKQWSAVFLPEGRLTDDGRAFAPGSVTWRSLPLTLMGMTATAEGHDGAIVCGRIDNIWRDEATGLIRADGIFDEGDYGQEIARMVADGVLTGVSVDVAVHSFEVGPRSNWFDDDGNWAPADTAAAEEEEPSLLDILYGTEAPIYVVTEAVIGATTVCPFPAFADASIAIAASLVAGASPGIWTVTQQGSFSVVGRAMTASGSGEEMEAIEVAPGEEGELTEALTASAVGLAPVAPPAEWFSNPELTELTPLTITDDGRIFGHAAEWGSCHIAFPDQCVTPPYTNTEYAYFHLGEIECVGGERFAVGKITLDAPHAGSGVGRAAATAHYDHTGTVAAHVICGEDEFGPWFAGAISPELSEEKVRLLRGSTLSGDWRDVNGNLELVALLAVNVPGFPVPRPSALMASGEDGPHVLALVAAGIVVPLEEREAHPEQFAALRDRAQFAEIAARARSGA